MILFFESKKRRISLVTLVAILMQLFYPTTTFALTGGPSQIEYENFEPAGATEMVNLATGDFVYNIPLLDVDGYPINISYHGGVNMEQEASWVGLGWSLNPGAISRGLRGFPDDFNGGENDKILEEINILENRTCGFKVGGSIEAAGFDPASLGASTYLGIVYNNYKGLGLEIEMGVTGSISAGNLSASGNLGLNISSQDGADFSMGGGLGVQAGVSYEGTGIGGSLGINRTQTFNSRRGLVSDVVSGSAGANISVYGATYGKSTGSAINLVPNTAYLPNLQYSTVFSGKTGEFKTGGEAYWCNFHGSMRAYRFYQGLSEQNISKSAFGYLNLENADYNSAMDFNRDNDGIYYTENPKLPFATLTYDLFNANAQGMNELFRPYRNDFGSVYDNQTSGGGTADDVGIEANYGNYGEIGANVYGVTSNSSSGLWANNAYGSGVRFKGDNQLANTRGLDTKEHAYFKALDELTIEDPVFYNKIKGDELSSFYLNIASGTSNSILENQIRSSSGNSYYSGEQKAREARNSNMSYLSAREASYFGLDKKIANYKENTFQFSNGELNKALSANPDIDRDFGLDFSKVGHHMSEMTILKEDGSRYIYGLPVYNKTQKEVVFNCADISRSSQNSSDGIVSYSSGSGGDNTTNNGRGRDHFFLKRTLPAYAHTYLLTALLSKDYVDVKGDGLTNDDFGDYTKFNYSRATSPNLNSTYSWRSPVTNTQNQAIYNPVTYSEPSDDKAVYISGEKEQWYVHSIETKNYIAEFFTEDRLDALGVSENGGILNGTNDVKSKLLKKIVLYSKKDITTPIKTVNFAYDYSLCPGTPNSFGTVSGALTKGKLTLKKIFFTYGNSDKGVFSPYKFIYADPDHDGSLNTSCNPSYDRMSMDRWGIYKPNSGADHLSGLNNDNFPYTLQKDSALANLNASVWNLSSIVTPAGSKIDVTYESDDYSYIQDKVPAQMLKMIGFRSTASTNDTDYGSSLYSTSSPYTPNNYMMIDLQELKGGGLKAQNLTEANNVFQNVMLPADNKIYFKGLVQIADGPSTREYVPGYAEFNRGSCEVSPNGSVTDPITGIITYKFAYIKLNEVDIEDSKNYANDNCNPISKAGWQSARLEHPGLAYPGSEPGGNGLAAVAALGASIAEVFTFKQKNNRLRQKGYSASIDCSMSFVRLNIPTKTKIGGGHRVSKIQINDNWSSMVPTEASTSYGQTYNYGLSNTGNYLSSGVAAYEPLAGGDEISLRKPVEYSVARILAPDDAHFFEEPIGEAFFPQATIIYSKITVRNLDRFNGSNQLITGNIGRTEYEFYTAKDFPISSSYDELQVYNYLPEVDGNLFNSYMETSTHASQGFILRLNNMHGKLKSVLSFQEGNNSPISGTKYTYKTTSNVNVLSNKVSSISEDGTIVSNFMLGQHVEAVGDFRRSNTITFGNTQNYNLNVSAPLPIPYPIPIPSYFESSSTEVRDFYSATLNKVVTQQGILEKVETISNYASSTTENLLWDGRTGNVVLSRTTTNFKDYDYSYATPAHWVYKNMGGAFQNIGLGFKDAVDPLTGIIDPAAKLLKGGDEVQLIGTNGAVYTSDRLWVSENSSGALVLMNRNGTICNTSGSGLDVFSGLGASNYVLKVLRSGFRNILDEEAEQITYSADPRLSSSIDLTHNIIDANAVEFSDEWQKYCPSFSDLSVCAGSTLTTNPYVLNVYGNWNEKRAYGYLAKRVQKNQTSGKFDIRKDGTFEVYKPFYLYAAGSGSNPGSWKNVYDPSRIDYNTYNPFDNWIMNSEVTKISPHGNILEAKDAINRYSSSLYGYNYSYKTASAVNSRQRDIGFDNFEDYGIYNHCYDNHFNFNKKNDVKGTNVTDVTAHTGRYCIFVLPNQEQQIQTVKPLTPKDCETAYGVNNVIPIQPPPPGGGGQQFSANSAMRTANPNCSCITDFSPSSDNPNPQKYVLSVWVREKSLNKDGDYPHAKVDIFWTGGSSLNVSIPKKSAIINYWQKLDYEFTIPPNAGAQNLTIRLRNVGTEPVAFDDIRIQPFNSTMITYVYDPLSLRLWAELDERNFATIYEYDNEGVLVRVKKETERGIITIKETRNSLKKENQ